MIPYASPLHMAATAVKHVRSRYQSRRHGRGSLFSYLILLLLGCMWGSCNQKDLLFPDEMCKVDIRFLWDRVENASPEGMTLLFYPLEEMGEFWRFEVSGKDGGIMEIPWGTYTLVAVNNDLPGVLLKDMPYSSASLTALDLPRSQTFASQVGIVYEEKVDDLKIMPGEVSYTCDNGEVAVSSSATVECYPDSVSTVYHIIIDGVEGIERVKSVEGVFEGCARGILLSSQAPLEPSVATQFSLEIDRDKDALTGTTTGFPDNRTVATYSLTLRLRYYAGGGYEKSFDVTSQVKNSFYPHNVFIFIKGLSLPEEPTIEPDEVGMKVDVDGWKVIEINLDSENY